MPLETPSRRQLLLTASGIGLSGLGLSACAPLPPAPLPPARPLGSEPIARVLAISDMHSAYERTAQLLAAFEAEIKSSDVPHLILINGDLFEHGNLVSVRSKGVVDWAFLAALPALAPTVFNLGNHDNDLIHDLHEVVARLRSLGIIVVSTIKDARTGSPYAEATATLPLGPHTVRVVGIGTDALHTYPAPSRPMLSIPSPGDWARDNLRGALEGADLVLVASHAGVAPDRDILPLLPQGALMIGGHNHLLFQHKDARFSYGHTGSWSNAYTVAHYYSDHLPQITSKTVTLDAPADPALALLIAQTLNQHLTDQDKKILGTAPETLSLGDTGRRVAKGMADAAGADMGLIGHTTLGTGLQAGPIRQFDYDAIVRFDGKLMTAMITHEQFALIMQRVNQDRDMSLADRMGDFAYGSEAPPSGLSVISIATTDWCARNQHEYFGTTDIVFTEAPSPGIKAIGQTALLKA